MTSSSRPAAHDLRCSSQARATGLEPRGTAASADIFLLVPLRQPWPAEVADHPQLAAFAPAVARAAEQGITVRVQGLMAVGGDEPDGRVICYRRPPGPFAGYARSEVAVRGGDVAAACRAALDAGAPGAVSPEWVTDLLICGHGARDRCCGSLGTTLALELAAAHPRVRVWRTSHLGGHRFAPTALLFPSGSAWAWLDGGLLTGILERSVPAAEAARHLRGCSGMSSPAAQFADAAALAALGWGWLQQARSVEAEQRDGGRTRVRLRASNAGPGSRQETDVVVELAGAGSLPQPKCGTAEPSDKQDEQLALVSIKTRNGAGGLP